MSSIAEARQYKSQIIELRSQKLTYKQIADKLGFKQWQVREVLLEDKWRQEQNAIDEKRKQDPDSVIHLDIPYKLYRKITLWGRVEHISELLLLTVPEIKEACVTSETQALRIFDALKKFKKDGSYHVELVRNRYLQAELVHKLHKSGMRYIDIAEKASCGIDDIPKLLQDYRKDLQFARQTKHNPDSIMYLPLTTNAVNALLRVRIKDIAALRKESAESLTRFRGIGPKLSAEIIDALKMYDTEVTSEKESHI